MRISPLFLFFVVWIACVNDPQDIPVPVQGEPVFYGDLTLDGELKRFAAGEQGYVMKTDHFVDGEGVTHYIASFVQQECGEPACPSLEFEFFDNQAAGHPESGVEQTFRTGAKDYYQISMEEDLSLAFFLGQDTPGQSPSYWTLGMDPTPITTSQVNLNAAHDAYFDLCFHRNGQGACAHETAYCFHSLASAPFIGVMTAERTFGEYIVVGLEDLDGTPPFQFEWMNGATTSFILLPAEDGQIPVSVTARDATLSTIEINQTLVIENGEVTMCGGNPVFVYSISRKPFTQFSTVIVRYTDENGVMYSSAFTQQTGQPFEIVEVRDFIAQPPSPSPTKQITLSLTAELSSADRAKTILLEAPQVVIGISYGG